MDNWQLRNELIPHYRQRSEYMKCRRLEVLTFRISNKGRLSGITAKTALTRLYFIYCVSHRFYYGRLLYRRERTCQETV